MRIRPVCILVVVLAVAVSGCVSSYFQTVVEIAASKRSRPCDGGFAVKKLNDWGYRVDVCEEILYYRCAFQRKSLGLVQCCDLVDDESAATALMSVNGPNPTCVEFAD